MQSFNGGFKRKSRPRPLDLEQRVAADDNASGYAFQSSSTAYNNDTTRRFVSLSRASGGGPSVLDPRSSSSSSVQAAASRTSSATTASTNHKMSKSDASLGSRFSRASSKWSSMMTHDRSSTHIVCAISENQARETCVVSIDASRPTCMQITKQANGHNYAETIRYLEILKPDEILLNEGRRSSHLACKVLKHYDLQDSAVATAPQRRRSLVQRMTEFGGGAFGGQESDTVVKFISRGHFDQTKGASVLQDIARPETYDPALVQEFIIIASAHALVNYLQLALGATFAHRSLALVINAGGTDRMCIDRTTMWQLELLANSKTGKSKNSLIGTIDNTKTSVGSRLLRSNLMAPPMNVGTINSRLELVETFLSSADFFFNVGEHLSRLPDVDRMLSNIALIPKIDQAKGDEPTERHVRLASRGIGALISVKTVISALPSLASLLKSELDRIDPTMQHEALDEQTTVSGRSNLSVGLGDAKYLYGQQVPPHYLLATIIQIMKEPALATVLEAVNEVYTESTTHSTNVEKMRHQECFALKDENGNGILTVLRRAYVGNVDDIYEEADKVAAKYNMRVTVRYTNIRGYVLSIPASHASEIPIEFLQPTRSGRIITFHTEKTKSMNLRARENMHDILVLTHERIQGVLDVARLHYESLASLSDAIALLDMCHSFADTACSSHLPWCRPLVSDRKEQSLGNSLASTSDETSALDSGTTLMIQGGRYCIEVEDGIFETDDEEHAGFTPNDVYADEEKNMVLITGINGSGKSVYLKQLAIIVVLAHCGSYVPAEKASIPIRDRLFSRIGNADDQEHNISTFMLEMKETGFICDSVTEDSIILIDELGRATSNEDGVAIAWAVCEYLLKVGVMTFFVTHYPQLSELGKVYPMFVQNIHLEACVDEGIKYTHKVKNGPCPITADYGVEMAALCGWPADTINDARALEPTVRDLLPENSVCHEHAVEETNARVEAYNLIRATWDGLQRIANDKSLTTPSALRDAYERLQQDTIGQATPAAVDYMDHLLCREESAARASMFDHQSPSAESDTNAEDRRTRFFPSVPTHMMSSGSPVDECQWEQGEYDNGGDYYEEWDDQVEFGNENEGFRHGEDEYFMGDSENGSEFGSEIRSQTNQEARSGAAKDDDEEGSVTSASVSSSGSSSQSSTSTMSTSNS